MVGIADRLIEGTLDGRIDDLVDGYKDGDVDSSGWQKIPSNAILTKQLGRHLKPSC